MTDDILYHEAYQSTLDALNRWNRANPTEDRDPGELLQSDDFDRFLKGQPKKPEAPTASPDDFGAGILDHEPKPRK